MASTSFGALNSFVLWYKKPSDKQSALQCFGLWAFSRRERHKQTACWEIPGRGARGVLGRLGGFCTMRGSSTNLVSGNQKAGRRLILGRCAISGGYGQSFNANTRSFGNFIARLWLLLIGLFGLRGTFTIRYIHFLLTLREYRRVSILLFYTGGSPVS